MNKPSNKKFNRKAFTLVELIIVITILAILATIAFISFQGYSKNARDGNRLTALRNIKTGLEIYYTQTGNYPDTESGTLIQSSGGLTTIGTQGYFGDTDSRLLKFSKTPTDPYDGSKYIYSVNAQKNKYQIMGFLETSDYVSLLNNTYAATDYSVRTPKTLGDNLGILLDSNNNPISGTGIDVENYNGSLKAIFNDNYNVSGTGIIMKTLKASYVQGKLGWWYYDKNCDLPDVVIGNQVWAGCNSTLGSGVEWTTNSSSGTCYSYSASTTTTSCTDSNYMASNKKEKFWSIASTDLGTVDNIWGKLYTWTGSTGLSANCKGGDFVSLESNSNCPCPTGWHIPTDSEWTILEKNLGCTDYSNSGYRCYGLGWSGNYLKDSTNNIVKALKIPLSGFGHTNGVTFQNRGGGAGFWSSSINGNVAYSSNFNRYNDTIYSATFNMKYALSVRCLKD